MKNGVKDPVETREKRDLVVALRAGEAEVKAGFLMMWH